MEKAHELKIGDSLLIKVQDTMLKITAVPISSVIKATLKERKGSQSVEPVTEDMVHRLCQRGGQKVEAPHLYDPASDVCIYCGDGAKPPPPEAFDNTPKTNRFETILCHEHGSHKLDIRPDGTYDKPDCAMFQQS